VTRLGILGAGIMGACAALAAQREGHEVTLIEPATPGGEQAASHGNGCWLSPASVVPPAIPGLWRKLPRFLRDPLGPLSIRWQRLPAAAPWLGRYLAAGSTEKRVLRTAHALRNLLRDAPALHAALAAEAGHAHLIEQRGLLTVFPDRAAFEAEAFAWRVRAATGVRWLELDADELRQRAPELDRRYTFGLLVEEGGHCRDPGAHVAGLVALTERQGLRRVSARATGFRLEGTRLRAIRTDAGEVVADRAIICAGIHSAALARAAGDRIPLESERGYHASIADPEVRPRLPMMPSDGKMGVTLTEGGLRAAGQVEIAGLDAAPDWRRAAILRDHLLRMFPALPRDLPAERVKVWMGHRPSTPDGLPVLGPSRASPDILHGFGHGHVGLAAAPRSALLLMDLFAGRAPSIPTEPYAPARFR
jgi:D-amino-acid dehydrogenase